MADLPPLDRLVTTRRSLHRAAEHVLAGALKRATGQIALRAVPGGVATPPLPDGTVVSLLGPEVVVARGAEVRRARLTTVRAAAELVGTEPGFPWTKQPPATPEEPDAVLDVDEPSAAVLDDWFGLGARTLQAWVREVAAEDPTPAQVFPEHFDLAISAGEVNYGFSPGDDAQPLPYVYVGPWSPPAQDGFWNAAFGAYRTIEEVDDLDGALGFLRAARGRLSPG
jgi:hypothetical protein